MFNNTSLSINLIIVFLISIKNVAHIGSYAATYLATFKVNNNFETHHLTKRMDLKSCLGQFDVHKNTIIRTGESQAIGGKYLQGIELETMEECQHLCCETDSCDVYIFESKKDGYCYLFECGTPENFHCKFTRHANYTSAVLTPVIRHVNNEVVTAHPPQAHLGHGISSNISQQEWELSNLKLKPEVKEKANDIARSEEGTINSLSGINKKSLTNIEETNLIEKVNNSAQCGRFQFACHSGECIAVYNACDGIPQCEDGSDEGPECSGANNNLNANTKSTQDATSLNKVIADSSLSQYSVSMSQQTPQQQLHSMQQHSRNSAILPSVVNNREDPNVWETRKIVSGSTAHIAASENHGNPESTNLQQLTAQQQLQQQQQQQQQTNSFTSYVNNREQNNAVYGVGTSTLKQSGIYMPHAVPDITNNGYAALQQQEQQERILLPPLPPPPPAPLNSNWQQQAILKQQNQQQQFVAQEIPQQQTLPVDSASYGRQNEAIQTQQQQQPQPQITKTVVIQQKKQQPAQNLVPSIIQQQQQQPQPPSQTLVIPRNGAANIEQKEDSDEYEDSEEKSTEPPKKHKHKKVKSKEKNLQKSKDDTFASSSINSIKSAITPLHEQYEIIHQNMALEFRDHDGQSERPGGAVLSLTLGLLITAALAILIGCRMRTVGRRTRRIGGKAPYSHEADFLHKHKKVKSKEKNLQKSKDDTSASSSINSIKSAITPVHEQYEILHQNMALEFRDHDGQSERPGGAVLSLTLGLLITAALAILIGCRMRTVGRRTRRIGGKAPYSHEADFLVNGMYL